MSSSSYTTHYSLSQFESLDKPSWLQDYNDDMSKIDSAIYEASQGGGQTITLYTTTGQNTDGAMTQKATTDMVFAGAGTSINLGGNSSISVSDVQIGTSSTTLGTNSVAVGQGSSCASNNYSTAIGSGAKIQGSGHHYSTSLGASASCEYPHAVALGSYSHPRAQGVVDVKALNGSTKYGYQGTGDAQRTEYRVISGVHAGEDDHDVAIVEQILPVISKTTDGSTPTNSTVGKVGDIIVVTYVQNPSVSQLVGIFVCITADTQQNHYEWRPIALQ